MISVVICSVDEAKFQAVSEQYRRALGKEPYEIICVRHAQSMCDGYNQGLDASQGDIVLFSHDDIEIWTPEFIPRLKRHLETFDVIGVAGTELLVQPGWIAAGPPHVFGQVMHGKSAGPFYLMLYGLRARVVPGIQAMDGLFLAFRRSAIAQLRWDAQTFTRFHCYDIDCTYRAYKMGLRLGVALDLPLLHMSGGAFDATWEQQAALLIQKHGIGKYMPPPFPRICAMYTSKTEAMAAMERVCATLP